MAHVTIIQFFIVYSFVEASQMLIEQKITYNIPIGVILSNITRLMRLIICLFVTLILIVSI